MNTLTDKAFAASLLAFLVVGLAVLLSGNEVHGSTGATLPDGQVPRITVTAKRLNEAEKRAMDQQERQQACSDTATGKSA